MISEEKSNFGLSQILLPVIQKLAVFRNKIIRHIFHKNEWYFSVIDVMNALTNTVNARDYWCKMKSKVRNKEGVELSTICRRLKMESADGKMRATDCANIESLMRIIQSIASAKAESFKQWLAKVGYGRFQEIENPELASKRARAIYKNEGYNDEWIEKRMSSIAIREELTDEWKNREISKDEEFAELTAEITKATFDMRPSRV